MPNLILVQEVDDTASTPEQVVFRNSADFAPASGTDLRTDSGTPSYNYVQLDMTSVADANARQSAKVDLGETRATKYRVRGSFELAATPTAGEVIELYWGESADATAADGNVAGLSGSDAAYTGIGSDLTNSVLMLTFIGVHVCTDDPTPTVQSSIIGYLEPGNRHGSLVVKNESGAAFHSDAVETHIVFDPILPEIQ